MMKTTRCTKLAGLAGICALSLAWSFDSAAASDIPAKAPIPVNPSAVPMQMEPFVAGITPADEEYGTLPAVASREVPAPTSFSDQPSVAGSAAAADPAFFGAPAFTALRGGYGDLTASLTSINGSGFWLLVPLDENETEYELRIFGDAQFTLDGTFVERGLVDVALFVGAEYLGGVGSMKWNGLDTGGFALPALSYLDVPVDRIADQGVLDSGEVAIDLHPTASSPARVKLMVVGEAVRLSQRGL